MPTAERRLGGGDLARPRHGLGRLSGVPHPARRGELEQLVELVDRREPGRRARRIRDLEQLDRGRVQRGVVVRQLLQPRHPDHGEQRRLRLRRDVAGVVALRHRGRRHITGARRQRPRAGRRRRGTAPGAAVRPTRRSRRAQTDIGCPSRTVADVSAVADPNTGVAPTTPTTSRRAGWSFGGTSVAAPIVASVYALAGNGTTIATPAYSYSHSELAVRRDVGKQRNVRGRLPVHGLGRLRRTDRARHAERNRRLLAGSRGLRLALACDDHHHARHPAGEPDDRGRGPRHRHLAAARRRHDRRDPRRVARAPRAVLPRSGPHARPAGRVRRALRRGHRRPSGRAVARGLQAGAADRQPEGPHELLAHRRDLHVASADRLAAVRGHAARGRRRHDVVEHACRLRRARRAAPTHSATGSSASTTTRRTRRRSRRARARSGKGTRSRSCGRSSIRSCACTPRPAARTCS